MYGYCCNFNKTYVELGTVRVGSLKLLEHLNIH